MRRNAVREILLEDPHRVRILQLDDGRKIRVRGVEYWLDLDTFLIVKTGYDQTGRFPYRKIASIQDATSRKRSGKKKTG